MKILKMECIYQKLDFLDVSFVQMFDLADLNVIVQTENAATA